MHSKNIEEEIRTLLAGTHVEHNDAVVNEYFQNSRSNAYAKEEDINISKATILHNTKPALLVEKALRDEANSQLTATGALSVRSGAKTGRSPKDKRIVLEPSSQDKVWWGPVNVKLNPEAYMLNRERAIDYLNTRSHIYVVDGFAGWDKKHRVSVRVVCCRAYHALFMRNMLVVPSDEELEDFEPDLLILNAGTFPANRYVEGMTSSCSVDLHLSRFSKRFNRTWAEMVILGTQYAGEMKKGVLTYMMYKMPITNQLCLHSSANEDDSGRVTVFFGLSGTGKTTLSADCRRKLIGDDEHVWTDEGVFNVEGGCYAKCIGLSAIAEPEIFGAIRFGSVVENVVIDEKTRVPDYDDTRITENTRCAYPLDFIPNAKLPAVGLHPTNVILLTCDGFGVLPPVSKLSPSQVVYHFLAGYTSKMAGTEEGVKKPTATFSACYGEPFLVLHPIEYGTMLAKKLETHSTNAWLLNTGWIGGSQGKRCPLKYTRAIVDAIHDGTLAEAKYEVDDVFNLSYPTSCANVPSELLNPSNAWADKKAFDETRSYLAKLFHQNFERYGDAQIDESVRAAGPL